MSFLLKGAATSLEGQISESRDKIIQLGKS